MVEYGPQLLPASAVQIRKLVSLRIRKNSAALPDCKVCLFTRARRSSRPATESLLQPLEKHARKQRGVSRRHQPETMRADVMSGKRNMGIEGCHRGNGQDKRHKKDGSARRGQLEAHGKAQIDLKR